MHDSNPVSAEPFNPVVVWGCHEEPKEFVFGLWQSVIAYPQPGVPDCHRVFALRNQSGLRDLLFDIDLKEEVEFWGKNHHYIAKKSGHEVLLHGPFKR